MTSTAPKYTGIELHELSSARPGDIELLRRFYTECYETAFPDPDERESLANMESYLGLKEQGWYGPNNYHIVIASSAGAIAGASVCDYLAVPNAGVVEYLLVQPDFRASGLGSEVLTAIEELCRADAAAIGRRELDWLVAETEDPYRNAVPVDGFDTFVRAHIMDRLNFRIVDFQYIQPALSTEQAPAENLLLIARSPCGRPEEIATDVVLSIVAEYMHWAMRIDYPTSNAEYCDMARSLAGLHSVKLVEFGEYLGWGTQGEMRINEVADVRDPELSAVVSVYDSVYTHPETAWPADIFRSAVERKTTLAIKGYIYHLWGIHSTTAGPCDGMVSFVTMPCAGFGGYMAFDSPLRGTGRLRQIIARIEEQMIRDNPDARGCYIECGNEVNRDIFTRVGFFELDVTYEQPLTTRSGVRTPPLRLHLLYKPFGRVYCPPTITRTAILQAVTEIYWSVYDVDAVTDASFGRLADSLQGSETVSAIRADFTDEVNASDDRGRIIKP